MSQIRITPAALLGANTFTGTQALPAGSAAAPSLTFGGEQTGWFLNAASDLRAAIAGTVRFALTAGTLALVGSYTVRPETRAIASAYDLTLRAGTVTTATNAAAGTLTLGGQVGTGAGAGGSILLQTPTTLASGATAQTAVTRLTLSQGAVTTDAWTLTFADAATIVTGTTTGLVIGQAAAKIGAYGKTPVVRPSGFTQTYATADKTLSAYTSNTESSAYTGDAGGIAAVSSAANIAKLADLNALRVAYENLRVFTEDLAAMVNAVIDDLQLEGWLG